MRIKLKYLAPGLIALFVGSAAVAQQWNTTYPTVGVGANTKCITSVNGTCRTYAPAGPTALTGNETYPADTNASGGQSPQTVTVPAALLGALPTQYVVPTNASTTTVNTLTGTLLLNPAGTLTTATVVFPAATGLVDGQVLRLTSSQTLTGLTVTAGAGTSISNAPTALTVSTTGAYGYEFIYKASNTTWYRLQ